MVRVLRRRRESWVEMGSRWFFFAMVGLSLVGIGYVLGSVGGDELKAVREPIVHQAPPVKQRDTKEREKSAAPEWKDANIFVNDDTALPGVRDGEGVPKWDDAEFVEVGGGDGGGEAGVGGGEGDGGGEEVVDGKEGGGEEVVVVGRDDEEEDVGVEEGEFWGLEKGPGGFVGIRRVPVHLDFSDCAIVTMAVGDESARMAVGLVQSLRDVGTRVGHIVVMAFPGGVGSRECVRSGRLGGDGGCGESRKKKDIFSSPYHDALRRLGAEVMVLDRMPETEFTRQIAGGTRSFWGMAFNKLRVFGLTQFRRVLYLDSDVLVLHNLDHLLTRTTLTAAFTNDCCNPRAPFKMSGGMWVFEPSTRLMDTILEATHHDLPNLAEWRVGDQELLATIFGVLDHRQKGRLWPRSRDARQGRIGGLAWVDPAFENGQSLVTLNSVPVGLLPQEERLAREEKKPLWHALDVRYDGLVGDCDCMKNRDLGLTREAAAEIGLIDGMPHPSNESPNPSFHSPWGYGQRTAAALPINAPRAFARTKNDWKPKVGGDGYEGGFFSVHFSCLPVGTSKPGKYETEKAFFDTVATLPLCMQRYFVLWYSKYTRAMKGIPDPTTNHNPITRPFNFKTK